MDYERIAQHWNEVFKKRIKHIPNSGETGIAGFDAALDWFCNGTNSVFDFGCGSGNLLMRCALRGTRRHIGLDISTEDKVPQAYFLPTRINYPKYPCATSSSAVSIPPPAAPLMVLWERHANL